MAVLVQEIINADYAFVIHTTNPSSEDSSEIYAEVTCYILVSLQCWLLTILMNMRDIIHKPAQNNQTHEIYALCEKT